MQSASTIRKDAAAAILALLTLAACLAYPTIAADGQPAAGTAVAAGEGSAEITGQGDGQQLQPAGNSDSSKPAREVPVWLWSLGLFLFCFVLGIIAVMAGVGGGVLFVPVVAAFFPFHMDFVRSTGLIIALAGAMAASPGLLRRGLGNLRLVLPCALMGSIGSIFGATLGLAMPEQLAQVLLGLCILGVAFLLLFTRRSEHPVVPRSDRLAQILQITGIYHEPSSGRSTNWQVHRTPVGLLSFVGVGFVAGMFGLGAGWANVPVFNLVMGVPLKVAVGSSVLMFSTVNATAAWVYLNKGAWLPVLALPSVIGLVMGTSIGVRLLGRSRPQIVRKLVIVILFFAAFSSLLKGLGVWS